jgi:hypothetical protein
MSIDLSIFNTFDVKWLLQDVGKAGEVQFNNAQNIIEMILFTPFVRSKKSWATAPRAPKSSPS